MLREPKTRLVDTAHGLKKSVLTNGPFGLEQTGRSEILLNLPMPARPWQTTGENSIQVKSEKLNLGMNIRKFENHIFSLPILSFPSQRKQSWQDKL